MDGDRVGIREERWLAKVEGDGWSRSSTLLADSGHERRSWHGSSSPLKHPSQVTGRHPDIRSAAPGVSVSVRGFGVDNRPN